MTDHPLNPTEPQGASCDWWTPARFADLRALEAGKISWPEFEARANRLSQPPPLPSE